MTLEELREHFNRFFGLAPWPQTFNVDHETYANVCQGIFNHAVEHNTIEDIGLPYNRITISIGRHNGIMYKGVELILSNKV